MKNNKFIKQSSVRTTMIFAALLPIMISSGKVMATGTPKLPTAKKKRSVVSTMQTNHESSEMKSILASTTGLKPNVLRLGLNAYKWAEEKAHVRKKYLTIVDFSIPSKDKRMWIINLNTDKVVMKTLVANGKGSGLYKGTHFSNRSGSLQSSLGVYVTGVHYYGNDGLSLHVHGLQAGINSNAYRRAIEFHGANYVSPWFASAHGRVGRSWGCFALNKAVLPKVIKTIQNGSVVFAYAKGFNQDYKPYIS